VPCLEDADTVWSVRASWLFSVVGVEGMRIELVFRTEDGDRFEIRDSAADFEGHAHGAILEDGEVFDYADRRWLIHRDSDHPARFICTPVDEPSD
jgi:hypothetical protein